MRIGSAGVVTTGVVAVLACSKPSSADKVGADKAAVNPAVTAHVIPGCGATLSAPATYAARTQDDTLLLVARDSSVFQASCMQKQTTAPVSLARHFDWMLTKLTKNVNTTVTPVDLTALGHTLGRAVLGSDVVATDPATPTRGRLLVIDSATAFYFIGFQAPAARWESLAAERDRVLATFHVTDRIVDSGPTRWWRPDMKLEKRSLAAARASFHTKVAGGRPARGDFDGKAAETPPAATFTRVSVRGPQGKLAAYVTPDPKDGKKHPVVVWAHGGFGGIDRGFWDPAPRSNDQSARAFRDAGIVLAVGSWRAENDNPGDYQLYYGEVDDYLALRDYVKTLPYVDPDRIYLAGHSSGGTLVLLAAELSDGFRAAFSIGGDTVMTDDDLETYERYGGVPFDAKRADEMLLRSPAPFVESIKKPTFYFEGERSPSVGAAQWMEDIAFGSHVPFKAFAALQANHFTILAPLTELIAKKIVADTGARTNITFTQAEIDALRVAGVP